VDKAVVMGAFRKVLTLTEPVEVVVESKLGNADILEMLKNM